MPKPKDNKRKKKKHIYSKVKTPILKTDKPITNAMEFTSKLHKKENVWSDFINHAIYNKGEIDVPYDEDIRSIFKHIKDRTTKKSILRFLMKVEGYDPFSDPLPLEKLPVNYRNYISKIQQHIRTNEMKVRSLSIQEKTVEAFGHSFKCCITEYTKENLNKELFAQGFDVLFLQKEGKFLITSSPDLKNRPNLSQMFEQLNKAEPEKWYLHGNQFILMTQEGKVSYNNIRQLVRLFAQSKG